MIQVHTRPRQGELLDEMLMTAGVEFDLITDLDISWWHLFLYVSRGRCKQTSTTYLTMLQANNQTIVCMVMQMTYTRRAIRHATV